MSTGLYGKRSPFATPTSPIQGERLSSSLRVAFALEQDVGHAVQSVNLQQCVKEHPEIDAHFTAVNFYQAGGLIEKLPFLPGYVRAAWRARLEVRRGLDHWHPDAIFWNTQKPAVLYPDLVRRVPSIISLDVTPKQYDAIGAAYGHSPDGAGPIAAIKHHMNRLVFRFARRLLPATEWVRRSLIEDYGVSPDRIEVLPPGTDLTRFHLPVSRPSDEDGVVRLLFIGGDFIRKGGDTLLEWFHTAADAHRAVLHIVTRDPIPASDRVFSHRITYDDDRLACLYREADVFVMPTRAECFGLVYTEAMASGLPVIACPVGGVPEVVQHGETGLLVPPGDVAALAAALTALIHDSTFRRRLGDRGRQVAEQRFDARKNVSRIAELLRSVVEEARADC